MHVCRLIHAHILLYNRSRLYMTHLENIDEILCSKLGVYFYIVSFDAIIVLLLVRKILSYLFYMKVMLSNILLLYVSFKHLLFNILQNSF